LFKTQDRHKQDQLGVILIALPIIKIDRLLALLIVIHLLIMIEAGNKTPLLQYQIEDLGAIATTVTLILGEGKALGAIAINLRGVMMASEIPILETALIQAEAVVEAAGLVVEAEVAAVEEEEETSSYTISQINFSY
jgi:hypothetical protein